MACEGLRGERPAGRSGSGRPQTEVEVEAQIELGKLGIKEVRKVRGQLLDTLYARLQKCGESVVLPVRRAVQAQPLVVVRLGVLTPTGVGVLALLG